MGVSEKFTYRQTQTENKGLGRGQKGRTDIQLEGKFIHKKSFFYARGTE